LTAWSSWRVKPQASIPTVAPRRQSRGTRDVAMAVFVYRRREPTSSEAQKELETIFSELSQLRQSSSAPFRKIRENILGEV